MSSPLLPLSITHVEPTPKLAGLAQVIKPADQEEIKRVGQAVFNFFDLFQLSDETAKKLAEGWWRFHRDDEEDGEAEKKKKEVVQVMPPLLTSVMPEDPHHHTLSFFPDPSYMHEEEALRLHQRADEEAAISAPKKKKNREEMGAKEYLTMVGGIIYSLVLAAIFRKQTMIAISTVAATGDFVRVGYKSIPAGSKAQFAMRAVALISLIMGVIVQLIHVDPKNTSLLKEYLKSLPFTNTAFGVFIKGDMKALKDQLIEGGVQSLHDMHLLDPKSKESHLHRAQLCFSLLQCALAIGLMNPDAMGPFMAAAAGLWLKTNMREGVNYTWEMIEKIEPIKFENLTVTREDILKGIYTALAITSAVSLYCLTKGVSSNSFVNFMLVGLGAVSTDTLMRTFKLNMDILTAPSEGKKEKDKKVKALTWKETFNDWKESGISKIKDAVKGVWESREAVGKKMAQGTAILGSVVVLSLFLGQVIAKVNPGLSAMIASNMDTPLKPMTKNILTHGSALSMLIPLISLSSLMAILGAFDDQTTSVSFAALIMTACFINLSLYLWKAGLRPEKIKKEKPTVEEIPDQAKAEKKADKKAKKAEQVSATDAPAEVDKKAAKKAKKADKKAIKETPALETDKKKKKERLELPNL